MIIAILCAVYGAVLLSDYRSLAKHCARGVRALYLAMIFISFAVLVLHELGVPIPSPTDPIEKAIQALFGK